MDLDSRGTVAAAILFGVIGVFALMTQPVSAIAFLEALNFEPSQAPLVPAIEILGVALSSLVAVAWVRKVSWRTAGAFAIAVVIAGNLLSAIQTDFTTLAIIRFATGFFGQGTAFAVAIAIISGTKDTERNFALLIAAQVAFGVLVMFTLPAAIEKWGYAGLMIPLAVLALLIAPLLRFIPGTVAGPIAMSSEAANSSIVPALIALLAMLVWCTGLGAVWGSIQLIGTAGGLTAVDAGYALGISSAVAIVGALTASALGNKLGRIPPVMVALAIQAGAIWLLKGEMTLFQFAATAAIFQIFWNLTGPYMMGAVAMNDASGRVSVTIPAAQTGGFFLGPTIAAVFMSENSYISANYVGIVCCVLAAVIFVPVALRLKKQTA
jgi:predicted MFS family arabinose efflux permease